MFGTDSSVGSTRALIEARLPTVREERTRLEEELAAVIAQENAMVAVLEGLAALSDAPLGEAEEAQAAPPMQPADEAPAAAGEPAEAAETAEAVEPAETADGDPVVAPAAAPAKKTAAKKTTKKAAAKKAVTKKTAPRKAAAGKGRAAKKSADPSAAQQDVPGQDAEQALAATAKKTAPRSAAKTAKTAVKTAIQTRKSARAKAAPAAADQAQEPSKGRQRRTDADSVLGVLRQAEEPLRARDVAERLGLADTNGAVDAVRTMLERLAKASRAQRTGRGLYAAAD
ncbi:prephenate dehydrogenase [Kitasatospora arboriphila]